MVTSGSLLFSALQIDVLSGCTDIRGLVCDVALFSHEVVFIRGGVWRCCSDSWVMIHPVISFAGRALIN